MRDLLFLALQLVVTLAKLVRPGGVHSVIAESLLLKHQLIISRRSRRRAPPLTTSDRFVLGLTMLFVRPRRVAKLAAILKPATCCDSTERWLSPNIAGRFPPRELEPSPVRRVHPRNSSQRSSK
jgi:hypothetical protein